jgi:phospholipid/cholesterol/gamma-HCH transport system substrate-binding protein
MAVGIAVVAVIVGAVAFAFRASNGLPFGQFTYVTVAFTDVGGLLEGDDLRINSVRVGRVEDIQLGENKALVHLRIDGREALYRDASAAMQSQSALGKKFVNLDPGNPQSGPLGEGIIDTTRTKVSNELDTLLDIFDPTTRAALASTVRETGIGAGGHGQDLQNLLRAAPTMLPDLAATAESLASRQAALPELLVAARRLSGRFTGREDNIRQLITQFDNTVRAISVDNGTPLTDTLKTLPDTLDRADQAFHSLHSPLANTEFALADLHDGARALGSATPDVRGVLTESNEPLGRVPHVSDLAVPAVDDLNDTVADLRPLAPRVASVLDHASTPLEVLKPYAPEMSEWFSDVGSALSQGAGDKHWLRLGVLAASDDVSGTVPGVKDPLLERDPYPAPGTARKIRKDTVLGGVR